MKRIAFPFMMLFSAWHLNAQISFTDRTDLLWAKDVHSGVPVAVTDMNGDGLVDIVALHEGKELIIKYQTPDPSRPFVTYRPVERVSDGLQNDICVADFNNDGAPDILMGGTYDQTKIYYSVPGTYNYQVEYLDEVKLFFSQGAITGDLNQDGWLDAVILDDNGLNVTLMNDGTGKLVVNDYIDFRTNPPSDNSGNYGAIYSDFDMDGDLDLYLGKCRLHVTDTNNVLRINALYVNDGNGNYIENAAAYGLNNKGQTWTVDFGDFDNDGDMDCLIIQNDRPNALLENKGNNTFVNIGPQAGLSSTNVSLQGMFVDFDNDGYLDILIAGYEVALYRNNGNKTFSRQPSPFSGVVIGTYALGDLNHDGFMDVYGSRVIPFNNPDLNKKDVLYFNNGNNNHFLSLALEDLEGNRSAIGAMAMLYGPWGVQIREVRAGEQYGVTNTPHLLFGLGQHTTYDSLVIRWPGNVKERYDNLEVDQFWQIQRGGCHYSQLEVFPDLHVLCDGSSDVLLSPGQGFTDVSWSNGVVGDELTVDNNGIFYALFTDDNGCIRKTAPIEVTIDPDTIPAYISYSDDLRLCGGDTLWVSLPDAVSYAWSNGATDRFLAITESGEYYAEIEGYCKTLYTDTLVVNFLSPEPPVTQSDTFSMNESAFLSATGANVVWFADPGGFIFLGEGNELVLEGLTETTTVYAATYGTIPGEPYNVGPVEHQGGTKYNNAMVNGGMMFTVYQEIILETVTTYTDSVGPRTIEIYGDGGFYFSKTVLIEAGTTVVDLDVNLPPGLYFISTNQDDNLNVFGANSPFLWRSSSGVVYPYEVPGIMAITNSSFGLNLYFYFYDWQISSADQRCHSVLVPATAVPDFESSTDHPVNDPYPFILAPNPTSGLTSLIYPFALDVKVDILTADGRSVYSPSLYKPHAGRIEMDLSALESGMYMVVITWDNQRRIRKLVKL